MAISGSRPWTFHTDRFYRESAASLCYAFFYASDWRPPPHRSPQLGRLPWPLAGDHMNPFCKRGIHRQYHRSLFLQSNLRCSRGNSSDGCRASRAVTAAPRKRPSSVSVPSSANLYFNDVSGSPPRLKRCQKSPESPWNGITKLPKIPFERSIMTIAIS